MAAEKKLASAASPADQIAPNPNLGTININSNTACNGANPFDNLGVLNNNGTLTNGSNVSSFPDVATLNNYGMLNNNGTLTNGGFFPSLLGTLNNYGTLNSNGTIRNDRELTNHGTSNNNGDLYYLAVFPGFANNGTLNNNGNLSSFAVMSNNGTLINEGTFGPLDVFFNRGMFVNKGTSFAHLGVNNTGVFMNRGHFVTDTPFTQSAGTMVNDGTIDVAAAFTSFSIAGGVLQGTGRITIRDVSPEPSPPLGGVFVNGGTIAPANSTGTLTIDGDLFFNSGTLLTEIAGTSAGQFDLLAITGEACFLSALFAFSFLDGFLPNLGDRWEFLTADGGPTGWENLGTSFSGLPSNYGFEITAENNGLWLSVAAIPEPEIYTMMGIGLGRLGWIRRRKKLKGSAAA
jgi:hypothetical protein